MMPIFLIRDMGSTAPLADDMHRLSWSSRMIGRGRRALAQICSIPGYSSRANRIHGGLPKYRMAKVFGSPVQWKVQGGSPEGTSMGTALVPMTSVCNLIAESCLPMYTPLPPQSAEQRWLVLALAAHLRPMQHAPVTRRRRWRFTALLRRQSRLLRRRGGPCLGRREGLHAGAAGNAHCE